jgi:RimJ/RimL family protein N-acetyltransferase
MLVLRRATASDARFVWEVNNQPDVRAQSLSTASIPWESHEKWFAKKVDDPATLFLIASANGADAGVVRFDIGAGEGIISIALLSAHRGGGIGSAAIAAATEHLFEVAPGAAAVAFVRPNNVASVRAFERAGYRPVGRAVVKEVEVLRLERVRSAAR